LSGVSAAQHRSEDATIPRFSGIYAFHWQLIMEGSSGNFAGITFGEVDLAFQRVEDYRPPRWPDGEHPKQYHLDFEVDEIEPEQRRVVELGATLQKDFTGPDGYGWQVYTDPAGHPFCLCRHEGVTWTDNGAVWP
jgi:glyoxalase superfamily protein